MAVQQVWSIEWENETSESVKKRWAKEIKDLSVPAHAARHLAEIFDSQDEYGCGLDGDESDDGKRITAAELLTSNESFDKMSDWCRNNCFDDIEFEEEKHYAEKVRVALNTLEDYYRGQRC